MDQRRTKIVCTLGPASESESIIDGLIRSGMNVARFNFSHGTHEYHGRIMRLLRQRCAALGTDVAVLLDTKGPEIRTGEIAGGGEIRLARGDRITVTTRSVPNTKELLSVSYQSLSREVGSGSHIYIADGRIDLEVIETDPPDIHCEVRTGGALGSRKNVNVPGIRSTMPAITDKDRSDISFGVRCNIDFVAASFIRTPENVEAIRELLDSLGSKAQIISKIEDEEGVGNIEEIIQVSDGIMIARGDLGVQLPIEQVPLVQKRIIRQANAANRAVIVATQMLDSMIHDPRPTRAELTDVANAIFDGADAVMLSGETASGKYPVESVETMDRIARTVESSPEYRDRRRMPAEYEMIDDMSGAIARSACEVADSVDAVAIVCPTLRGNTPRIISRFRPHQTIIAATTSESVLRNLLLYWGVFPVLSERASDSETMVQNAIRVAMESGIVSHLDRLVSVAGVPVNSPIMMNTVRVHLIGTVLAKGKHGAGPLRSGRIVKILSGKEARRLGANDVAVVKRLDRAGARNLAGAAAVIVEGKSAVPVDLFGESGDMVSIVTEVTNAFDSLEDGATVTVDGRQKLVYDGVMIT